MAKRDGVDKFLAVGGGFDWITPVVSLLGGMLGRVVTFKCHRDDYPAVQMRLLRAGIRCRNVNTTGDMVVFDVRRDEAGLSRQLLR
jgi:hypothetical protein